MLGEIEAPDLIRGSPESMLHGNGLEGGNGAGEVDGETVRRNLKRGSVELQEGIEGLEMDEESEGGSGDSSRKRRA